MAFDYARLKDPSYFRENRLAAHSDHVVYASLQELEEGESSLYLPLNGYWKFFCAQNEGQVPKGFEAPGFSCAGWADIPVPAHIQMEGYGAPQYSNVPYPWDGRYAVEPGELPDEWNPVACYVKTFSLPQSMRGRRVYLSFQGAESCVAVWLNGRYVGFASDSFTPDEFELTPFLEEGINRLACRVYRFSAGSWLEDQDFMRFSGLFRDVYLCAVPQAHLRDLRVKTLLSDDLRDAVLEVKADVQAANGWRLSLRLLDGERTVAGAEASGEEGTAELRLPVAAPKLWSSERPALYRLLLTVALPDGTVVEAASQKVGFRRFEMRGGMMHLNGRRIVFKGVNRHDFCAGRGRCVTPDVIRRDLLTMKRNNINAVRTSHYPNHSALYDLCDELGLYVIDEVNLETHGVCELVATGRKPLDYLLPGNRAQWRDILLDRVQSTYDRDKNHPCVLIWSCGNESYGGDVIYDMSALFRRLDDTRLVHYENIRWDRRRNDTSDMESQMYTPVAGIRAFLAEHRDKPFIMCEYAHAMGNSCGALHKYTEYAYEEPLYQGGFIWDYIDQSIRAKDRYGQTAYLYGGDYGDRPTDGNFCGNGIVYGDGSESPKMQEVRCCYQNIAARVTSQTAVIENRHLFTPTSAFECLVTLQRDGVEVERAWLETDVAPGETKACPLPLKERTAGGEYAVTLSFRLKEDTPWAQRGHEVAFAQGVYRVAAGPAKPACDGFAPLRAVHGLHNVGVRGEHFEALFSTKRGGLVSYRFGGREMLKDMPMPNFWRAPTDNDRGWQMPSHYGQWKLASLYAAVRGGEEGSAVEQNGDGTVTVRFVYDLHTTPAAACSVAYRVHPGGRVDVSMRCDPPQGLPAMPEFGLMMRLDADYDRLRWYGLGPAENYADRCHGARLGIWQNEVRDNLAHYLVPQECGAHTGVRWAEVTDPRGRGLRFTGDGITFSALPYTPHELECARHENELPPVHDTVIRAALAQMGVGGDDSWGARPHDEYLLQKPPELCFSFEGIV